MKEKIIAILEKHHLQHYGNFEKAVIELNNLFEETINKNNVNKSKIIRNS
jgi:hypothetical protein